MSEKSYEQHIANKIDSLSISNKAFTELLGAKIVKVKTNRKCSCCNEITPSGNSMVTASRLEDKANNITYRKAKMLGTENKFNYVRVRHWICFKCTDCLIAKVKRINKNHLNYNRRRYRNIPFDEIDLEEYDEETQLDIIAQAYNNGELTSSEYEDMQNALIHYIAMRDAEGIGQE